MIEVNQEAGQDRSVGEPPCPITTIVVDHRETASGLIDILKQMPGVEVRVEQLPVGDYLVNGVCLFERKTLRDFAASIIDGRLFSQASRLAAGLLRAAVILEGTARDLEGSAMHREALLGAVVSLTLIFDLPVLRSREPAESARLLIYAAQQLRRDASDALPRRGKRPKGKRRIQLRVLQGLPGIGPDRAAALLERFGNVQAVMTATPEALVGVDGIGEKIAWRLRAALE
jgi:DNA excision repair protein ERCC-4